MIRTLVDDAVELFGGMTPTEIAKEVIPCILAVAMMALFVIIV